MATVSWTGAVYAAIYPDSLAPGGVHHWSFTGYDITEVLSFSAIPDPEINSALVVENVQYTFDNTVSSGSATNFTVRNIGNTEIVGYAVSCAAVSQ
jgi:hypothetical protein